MARATHWLWDHLVLGLTARTSSDRAKHRWSIEKRPFHNEPRHCHEIVHWQWMIQSHRHDVPRRQHWWENHKSEFACRQTNASFQKSWQLRPVSKRKQQNTNDMCVCVRVYSGENKETWSIIWHHWVAYTIEHTWMDASLVGVTFKMREILHFCNLSNDLASDRPPM